MQPVTRHVELFFRMFTHMYISCRRGVVTSVVCRMNEVTLRRVRLVPGRVTIFGRVYHHGK